MKLQNPKFMTASCWPDLRITNDSGGIKAYGTKDHAQVTFQGYVEEEGIRIKPDGVLTIRTSGDRDPDWRERTEKRFGVKLNLASEFAKQLVCPHTKQVIPVSRIIDNPVLWVDQEFGIAIASGHIKYETPDSPPTHYSHIEGRNLAPLKYSFTNQKRTKEFLKRLAPLRAEAELRLQIMPQLSFPAKMVRDIVKFVREKPEAEDIISLANDPENMAEVRSICMQLAGLDPNCGFNMENIKLQCADHYESDYLEYHP
jgi:hypothetical protein